MNSTWITKKLSDVCDNITDGTHQTPKYFDQGHIFLSSRNVKTGIINWDNIKYLDDAQHELMQKRLSPKRDDVLLAKNGTTGVAAIVDRDVSFDIYVSLALLRPLECLVPRFLLHFVNSPIAKAQFNKRLKGIGVPNLHLKEIREVEIKFPKNLEQQKQIVAKLDQAFADIEKAKANAEQNLKNAKELFGSYLSQIFSQCDDWKITTLGGIAEISSGGTPRKSTKEFWSGDIAWYSSGELNDLYTQESKEKITKEGLSGSNAKLFPKGSLLIGMYDTAALKMSILDRDGTFNQAVVGVKPNDNINLEFILHSINSIKPELLQQRSGVRQQNLNQAKIKNIPIKLPSIENQNEVVVLLKSISDECDKLSGIYKNKLENLKELKQSILQKAFNGELA
jgi:type I restriction enzyme S subunit